MDIEGIPLGIVNTNSAVGGFGIAEGVAVEDVMTTKFVAVVAIDVDYITIRLGEGTIRLIIERIAFDADTFIADDGTIQQVNPLSTSIIATVLAIDMIVPIIYVRGPHDACKTGFCVIV